jgi:hypothetical protein
MTGLVHSHHFQHHSAQDLGARVKCVRSHEIIGAETKRNGLQSFKWDRVLAKSRRLP